ncbi:MAG TPA: FAD-binding oxidoreductase [Steroidobacteraceae bacterium]|nr:FAD-binding oxidoreductase [Steroidobacteraceae bacterium]
MPSHVVLPADVSSAVLERALGELRRVLGEGFVATDAQLLQPYEKLMLPANEEDHRPAAVLMPASVQQVQAVLGICNRYRLPLWPTSTGRNFGYGSALPATRGQLILDLKRMNAILEVDPQLCTALVEPGVTYQQLHDFVRERNLPLWLDLPGTGPLAGPLGNTLERGVGQTPYADHFAHACGMEVVLADGRVLRTGMGSIANGAAWQVYRYGYGPYLDGIFTQSNFGIVTKLGLWLMPAPPAHRTILVQYWEDHDLAKAVDTIRQLRLGGTLQQPGVLANATLMLTAYARRAELFQGEGAVPDEVLLGAARQHSIAAWNVAFTLYGTAEQIAPQLELTLRTFEASGARVVLDYHEGSQVNELDLNGFSLLNWVGGGGLAWLTPVSAARGADAVKQRDLAKGVLAQHGFDYLAAPTVGMRDLHHQVALVFDRTNPDALRRARACFRELASAFADNGYGLYRVGIDYMSELAQQYGQANRDVNRALKRALDPNGILAPGKSGIHL